MNKEIEAQYDKILGCSTLTDLRKIEDDLQMTRMLLINYHNICLNLKQALNEIREYVKGAYEMATYTKSVSLDKENIEDILQIIDKYMKEDDKN